MSGKPLQQRKRGTENEESRSEMAEDGKPCGTTRGMAYIMHEERKLGVPSIHYLEVLAKAYEKFGFDEEILGEAYDYSDREPEKVPPESLSCLW